MSGLRKGGARVEDLAEGDAASSIDWRPLQNFSGPSPALFWATLPHEKQLSESDGQRIPGLGVIGARYTENAARKERDVLLASKVFWDVFRRSKLVILFDRHSDRKLLHRLRDELEPGRARSLQTLMLFAGKDDRAYCKQMAKNIQDVLANGSSPLKFHYIDGMMSNKSPYPHDRFAVTDGEFWHFGGSVGGVELCLTAVSRGWKAKDVGVEDFVKTTWAAAAQWE